MPRIRDLSRTNGVKRVPHLYSIVPAMASHQLKQLFTAATGTNASAAKSTTGRMRSSYVYRNTRTNKPKKATATTKSAAKNRATWPIATRTNRKPKPTSNGKKK
jgi:hypothetical protein